MVKNFLILILTIFLCIKGSSQFIIQNWEQSKSDYFHTLLPQTNNNQFQFLVLRDIQQLTTFVESAQILTYNFNGQLIDSVNLPRGFEPNLGPPAKHGHNYYWVSIFSDTIGSNSNLKGTYLLKFDTLFNCIQKVQIGAINSQFKQPSNTIIINNCIFFTIKNVVTNELKLLKYSTNLIPLDSISATGPKFANWLEKTESQNIMLSGLGFPAAPSNIGQQKIIVDTLLNLLDVFTLDSLTYITAGGSVVTGCSAQIGVDNLFFKVIPITKNKNFIIGTFPVPYNNNCNSRENIVHSVIDNSNEVINTTLISDTTKEIRYADGTNYATYSNNYIYTVASEGYFGWILDNNNTSILVTKSDTLANLIWKKSYGNDMFYRPVSIIQTLDSGFLISGIRYDYQNTAYTGVAQGFILRLDKNGDMISTGIKDNENAHYSSFKCYPNPSKDFIKIDVPFVNEYEVYVYNVLGELLMQEKKFKNLTELNTQALSTGTYILKIKTKDTWLNGKFIKE
jgi:hypothetical protein